MNHEKKSIATAGCGLSGSLKKSLVFRRANIGSASVRPPATASRPRTHPRASGAKPERFERFEGKRTRRSIARRGSPEKEQPLGARSLGAPCSFRGRERDDARAYVSRQGAAGARGALRRARLRARCVLKPAASSRASACAIAARSKRANDAPRPFFPHYRTPMPPSKRAADTSPPPRSRLRLPHQLRLVRRGHHLRMVRSRPDPITTARFPRPTAARARTRASSVQRHFPRHFQTRVRRARRRREALARFFFH